MADTPLYDRVGGHPFFRDLVDRFYAGVDADPVLRPLYPDDLSDAKRHLELFLVQYWGGPGHYAEERGHPRLRMRHFPFRITGVEAEHWWQHMRDAVESSDAAPQEKSELLNYFESAATFLVNAE